MKENGRKENASTALVVQRLSIVPQGAESTALAIVDEFALAAPIFVEGSEQIVVVAEAFDVDNHVSAETADEIQNALKTEIREWDERRLGVTRPIDDLKNFITGLIKVGIDNRRKAIGIYQGKMTAYRARVREDEQRAQREAERLLREERERLEAEARKQDERAAQLKTEAARQRAADDAARLREEAALVPESVAVATSAPVTTASNVASVWKGSIPLCDACKAADNKRHDPKRWCPHNRRRALQTILTKFDEWGGIIEFKQAGMNDMARKYKDTLEMPGFKFEQRDSYLAKPR